jgi:TRAP-type C4-dicarboxylate transport system, small permease component
MKTLLSIIDKLEEYLLVIGTVVVIIVIFGQVVMRYAFHNSFSWAEELSRYIFVYLTWIGASVAIKGDRHISITILGDKLPRAKKYFNLLSTLICLALSAFLLINGLELIGKLNARGQLSVSMGLPMWLAYLAVPAGGGLMALKYVYKLVTIDLEAFREEV